MARDNPERDLGHFIGGRLAGIPAGALEALNKVLETEPVMGTNEEIDAKFFAELSLRIQQMMPPVGVAARQPSKAEENDCEDYGHTNDVAKYLIHLRKGNTEYFLFTKVASDQIGSLGLDPEWSGEPFVQDFLAFDPPDEVAVDLSEIPRLIKGAIDFDVTDENGFFPGILMVDSNGDQTMVFREDILSESGRPQGYGFPVFYTLKQDGLFEGFKSPYELSGLDMFDGRVPITDGNLDDRHRPFADFLNFFESSCDR